jgi:hypothetical protein
VDGVVWLPTKFTDLQTPKIYVTDSVSDGLDQGTSIKISGTPRVNYSDPNQSSDKIAKAIQFAKINQQVLLDHWHYQICSAEAIIRIKAQKSE